MQAAARASIQSPRICCALTFLRALAVSASPAATFSPIARRRRSHRHRPDSSKREAQYDRFDVHREHKLDTTPSQAARKDRLPQISKHNAGFGSGSALIRYRYPGDQSLGGNGEQGRKKDKQPHPIIKALRRLRHTLHKDPAFTGLKLNSNTLEENYEEFYAQIDGLLRRGDKRDPLLRLLHNATKSKNPETLENLVKLRFFRTLVTTVTDAKDLAEQLRVANLAYPSEWFPATRRLQRQFHLHVGPTNSGKTYHALKRLEQAEQGVYAGPLRLLAHEVYMKLNARGRTCNLITGDDRRFGDVNNANAPLISCTVEMMPLNWKMDVAIIDEIQMLGSDDRGWAWSQAVLGVKAREVHLCGEERAVPIMRELAALCGDTLQIHRYKRLSPLKMAPKSLNNDLTKLRKGDCIVCFSVVLIHALRQVIEKTLKCNVAVVYGSLPPETRAQQAQLFNDPNNDYDILVASDAVGMGLNLSIKRMIFHTSSKLVQNQRVQLQHHEIKQIAGRAGRFFPTNENNVKKALQVDLDDEPAKPRSSRARAGAAQATMPEGGLVTTLERYDYPRVALAMTAENQPIKTAGIFPPSYIVERFATLFPRGTPFSFLLMRLNEIAKMTPRFHICDAAQHLAIADAIESAKNLRVSDRLIFCSAPSDPKKKGEMDLVCAYAHLVAENRGVTILDVPELNLDLLEDTYPISRDYLRDVESLHKGVVLWLWLSYRYEKVFLNRELATHVKELVEKRIADMLAKLSFDYERLRAQQALLDAMDTADSEVKVPDRDERGVGPSDELVPDDEDDELEDEAAEEGEGTEEILQYELDDQPVQTDKASADSAP